MAWHCNTWENISGSIINAHARDGEEAFVEVSLVEVKPAADVFEIAVLRIAPSWKEPYIAECEERNSIEVLGDEGYTWKVSVYDAYTTPEVAKVQICYEADEEPTEMEWGEKRTKYGVTFELASVVCSPVQKIVLKAEGLSQTIKLGAWALFPGPLIMGGIWVVLKSINAACDHALIKFTDGGLDEDAVEEIDERLKADYTRPDGSKPTEEEIHATKMDAIDHADWSRDDIVAIVRDYLDGVISKEEFNRQLGDIIYNDTINNLNTTYYTRNFTLNAPRIAIAGDIRITGTAPMPNQKIQIRAKKKGFGFDFLAADPVLAEVTADENARYSTSVELEDFGGVSIYATVPKEWWEVLEADVSTKKHTIFVVTWLIIIAVLAAAVMIYDKKTGGKFIGLFKKKR